MAKVDLIPLQIQLRRSSRDCDSCRVYLRTAISHDEARACAGNGKRNERARAEVKSRPSEIHRSDWLIGFEKNQNRLKPELDKL